MTSTQRYRTNPEYRERVILNVKARHAQHKHDPTYRKLVNVRKKIWDRRDSIERFQDRIASAERDLFSLIRKRDRLAQKWKEKQRAR
jgi:hypothetical protein